MAQSVIAIDAGLHSLKAVCVTGSAKAPVLTRVAILPQSAMAESIPQATEKAVSAQFKELTSQLKGKGECHFVFNSPQAVLRYVESPFHVQADLRSSLKLNHQTYLRQNFDNYTFDGFCLFSGPEKPKKEKSAEMEKQGRKGKTLIAGLPSSEVLLFYASAKRAGLKPGSLSLAPLSLIDGFEAAYPERFREESVLLLDIGHLSSSLTIIHRGSIFLTRVVSQAGKSVLDALVQSQGGIQQAIAVEQQGGEALAETVQSELSPMMREVHSSVNFFERNADTDLKKIYMSGMLVRAPGVVDIIQREVGFPCETWNPAEGMKVNLPAAQQELYSQNLPGFAVCIGTARTALK